MFGVLHECSEVVLWKLLHIQMIFDVFVGEKVIYLPVLFLCHLLYIIIKVLSFSLRKTVGEKWYNLLKTSQNQRSSAMVGILKSIYGAVFEYQNNLQT